MTKWLLASALAIVFQVQALASDVAKPSIMQVARTHLTVTGQKIVVPAEPDVVVSIATFQPGARIAEHKHPFPHHVYVMNGVLTVTNTETGKSFEVRAGNFVAEMMNTWHFGQNKGREPVRLLVADEVPQGTKTNTVPK